MMTKTRKREFSVITYTGKRVWPCDLRPSDIDPLDIAHGLANICRYNGSVIKNYSVAQHTCLMHDKIDDPKIRKQIMFHDAPEYLIGDMVAPLKHMPEFDFYRQLEDEIMHVICHKFNLPYTFDPVVKELDLAIREAEIRDLKDGAGSTKTKKSGFKFETIIPWSHQKSKIGMIKRMAALGIEVEE